MGVTLLFAFERRVAINVVETSLFALLLMFISCLCPFTSLACNFLKKTFMGLGMRLRSRRLVQVPQLS